MDNGSADRIIIRCDALCLRKTICVLPPITQYSELPALSRIDKLFEIWQTLASLLLHGAGCTQPRRSLNQGTIPCFEYADSSQELQDRPGDVLSDGSRYPDAQVHDNNVEIS